VRKCSKAKFLPRHYYYAGNGRKATRAFDEDGKRDGNGETDNEIIILIIAAFHSN